MCHAPRGGRKRGVAVAAYSLDTTRIPAHVHRMRFSIALAALVKVGCRDAVNPAPTMTGQWRQSGQLADVATGDTHIHVGTFALVQQADGSFNGTGVQGGLCSHAGSSYQGPLTDGQPFAVFDGRVRGDSVELSTPLCHLTGHFTDASQSRMVGAASCAFTWNGNDYRFLGQWQADR